MPVAATAALTGLVPVVVTGGVVMKFSKAMFPAHSGRMGISRRRKSTSRKRKGYRSPQRNAFGGVSPI